MDNINSLRKIQLSVTNFLHVGDEYLFLHRSMDKKVDPGRLNGIGGKVEAGENYLDAAIRETEEETGYKVSPEDISLAGIVKLEGGYEVDWLMCFFKIRVPFKEIPVGNQTDDGELIWLHKDKVLNSSYELVDDLNYCFKEITEGKSIFFLTAEMDNNEKVSKHSFSKISD